MKNRIKNKFIDAKTKGLYRGDIQAGTFIIFFMFILGCFAGSLFGMFSPPQGIPDAVSGVLEAVGEKTYTEALGGCAGLHLLVVFLSTSIIGFFCIPVAAMMRGCFLSCASAAIISAYGIKGCVISLTVLGIPAIFTLPCFFVLSVDGFYMSRSLLYGYISSAAVTKRMGMARHIAVAVVLMILSAAIEVVIIPQFVLKLI